MSELDELLSGALKRVAEPGDPTGVADAIRSRLAAGDIGTPAQSSGFGGGLLGLLPWAGLIVVAGVAGGALGASGAVGAPGSGVVVDVPTAIGESAAAYACVEGPRIGRLPAGTRVLVVGRSEDATSVGVRDPGSLGSTIWVALDDVTLDGGTPALDALPVGGACPEVNVVIESEAAAAPAPTEEPAPGPAPKSQPSPAPQPQPAPAPSESVPPKVTQYWLTPDKYVYDNFPGDNSVVLHALASDNVGVAGVDVSWSGVHSGSATMTQSGGEWRFTYIVPVGTTPGDIVFTLRARDAANNFSAPVNMTVINNRAPD